MNADVRRLLEESVERHWVSLRALELYDLGYTLEDALDAAERERAAS